MTANFHPDRMVDGSTVMKRLAKEGRYRSQFETGVSNGGLTAFEGGDRWVWESRIFGGAYDGMPAAQRPVYGALNHRGRPVGGSHRFGSCHVRLRPEVIDRSTFCYPDSVFDPTNFGVADACDLISRADDADASADPPDLLDDYVEGHVHGPVLISTDVEAVVLDPSFRETRVQEEAEGLGCPIEWHHGFALPVSELDRHRDYRGQEFVRLAMQLADGGILTPRVIGDAARSGDHDDQALKRVWHILARFG